MKMIHKMIFNFKKMKKKDPELKSFVRFMKGPKNKAT